MKAAYNLVTRGITNLVVIGGDGSLTGANLFRQEWGGLLDELLENNKITKDQREKYKHLHIAGMVNYLKTLNLNTIFFVITNFIVIKNMSI